MFPPLPPKLMSSLMLLSTTPFLKWNPLLLSTCLVLSASLLSKDSLEREFFSVPATSAFTRSKINLQFWLANMQKVFRRCGRLESVSERGKVFSGITLLAPTESGLIVHTHHAYWPSPQSPTARPSQMEAAQYLPYQEETLQCTTHPSIRCDSDRWWPCRL